MAWPGLGSGPWAPVPAEQWGRIRAGTCWIPRNKSLEHLDIRTSSRDIDVVVSSLTTQGNEIITMGNSSRVTRASSQISLPLTVFLHCAHRPIPQKARTRKSHYGLMNRLQTLSCNRVVHGESCHSTSGPGSSLTPLLQVPQHTFVLH